MFESSSPKVSKGYKRKLLTLEKKYIYKIMKIFFNEQ